MKYSGWNLGDKHDYEIGDIVALVPEDGSGNGAGEGVLWRVTKVVKLRNSKLSKLYVEPAWCATGAISLRPKSVPSYSTRHIGFVELGQLRSQLDDMCREALARSVGVVKSEA